MKQIISLILKGLLVLVVVALALLIIFGAVLLIGWPWWVGIFILLGIIGLALAVMVLRKFFKRRSEQMFVQQVIAQDEAGYAALGPDEKSSAKELQARWKEAVDALRKSHLRKFGNPLYVLPWYMVIGESGSGKTTAIKSARLSSPFAEMTRTSGISGTRNCDWWFFEQAILIDTAGRYAVPVNEGQDKDEWQAFLSLLAKFRKKEPLNGLVVTVAADHLSRRTKEELEQEGLNIRRRIEELMRVLGAKFPVYLMVSKCDLIQGAAGFCDLLPEKTLNQAMGLVNDKLTLQVQGFVEDVFRTVSERLRELRLLLLNQPDRAATASSMMLFPEELEKLREPLQAYINGTFQENPYQETPLLRGVYFSSGRQEGTPFSHFLNALGLIQGAEVLDRTNKGLFLHDFFSKVLPRDRRLFRPTQYMVQWRNLTRNMGLTAWIAIVVAACGLLSYVFVKNLNALSDIRKEFGKTTLLQGELTTDVIALDRFQTALASIEEHNRNWWVPRMGLNASEEVEGELKQKFVHQFQTGFLTAFDKAMGERMTRFDAQTPAKAFGAHVIHLARRINMLKARLGGQALEQLLARSRPAYDASVLGRDDVIPDIQDRIGRQSVYALAWQQDEDALNQRLNHLQTWLKHLLTLPGGNLNWLAAWVDADPNAKITALHDFWGGAVDPEAVMVTPAFTTSGKDQIDGVLAEIEAALNNPLLIAGLKADFTQWYRDAYLERWHGFVQAFFQGPATLSDRDQWQAVARQLLTDQGPYYALIYRLQSEFEPWIESGSLPSWVGLAYDWQAVRKQAAAGAAADLKDAGLVRKATSKVSSKLHQAEHAIGVKARAPLDTKVLFASGAALAAYEKELAAVAKGAESRQVAFKQAEAYFSQDPVTGESAILAAHRALVTIRDNLTPSPDKDDDLFWRIAAGNLDFLKEYICREAACVLQEHWEQDVLLKMQDVGQDQDVARLMMGPDGFATRYLNSTAAPFVTKSLKKGYFAKTVLGKEIALVPDFFTYLTKSAKASGPTTGSYKVKIKAYPTDTNQGAQVTPHSTLLEMECADRPMRLENLNFPISKTFVWRPSSCGDVVLKIMVGNLILTKTYSGYNAFAKFLNDFKTGQHMFPRSDFPSEEAALRRMKIKYLKVKYQFQGHRSALKLLYNAPGRPLQNIAVCWE